MRSLVRHGHWDGALIIQLAPPACTGIHQHGSCVRMGGVGTREQRPAAWRAGAQPYMRTAVHCSLPATTSPIPTTRKGPDQVAGSKHGGHRTKAAWAPLASPQLVLSYACLCLPYRCAGSLPVDAPVAQLHGVVRAYSLMGQVCWDGAPKRHPAPGRYESGDRKHVHSRAAQEVTHRRTRQIGADSIILASGTAFRRLCRCICASGQYISTASKLGDAYKATTVSFMCSLKKSNRRKDQT